MLNNPDIVISSIRFVATTLATAGAGCFFLNKLGVGSFLVAGALLCALLAEFGADLALSAGHPD
jgi:hypothetical protein